MASFEGPAPVAGGEFGGVPASPVTAAPAEAPKLTPERAQQELARLTAIIKDNPNLHFLEPRVVKCAESGTQDSATFLSFYRLVSQSLSEELVNQRERLKTLEDELVKSRQSSAQNQMEAALVEASNAVNRVTAGQSRAAESSPSPSAAEGERSPQVDELLKRLEQAEVQRERLLQDMQNMRNRNKTDVDVKVFKAVEKFTQSLLPALDAFHQAMPSLQTATDTSSIVTGIEMIHEQLQNALIQAGLKKMEVIGTPFDPHLHEAIGDVESNDYPDDHVYDELQPGYMFGERMIRAAIVRLARNNGAAPAPVAAPAPPAPTEHAQTAPPQPESPPPASVAGHQEADPTAPVHPPTEAPPAPPSVPTQSAEAAPAPPAEVAPEANSEPQASVTPEGVDSPAPEPVDDPQTSP